MPQWEINTYYSFKDTNPECSQLATDLLNSYPLTRGCLETLGQVLKDQLQFGYFPQGKDIIVQGESGRDIFLLCTGTIDVLVADQVVVQMKSPTLVGDKGIVSDNSQRAATIRISSEQPALVIKIPMGNFIREFKNTEIEDESFNQEQKIFENVFQTVQERLFEFIYLQKTLWEQASNTIQLINQQIYAKQLDNKIEPNWNAEAWSVAQNYLKSKLGINWPPNVQISANALHAYLRKYFDIKYKNAKQPNAIMQKKLEWRNTLTEIAGRVLRSVPDDKKAVPGLDLELFNPNIYRMRLTGLQNQLEKRYAERMVNKGSEKKKDPTAFFGKGDRSNEFNLPLYLEYFHKMYRVKNPRRLLAQVGQKCALIAAECENNFNSSVVKMQKFLEEVKSRNISLGEAEKKSEVDPATLKSWVAAMIRGIHHYRDSSPAIDGQTLGVLKFSPNTFPNFTGMVKAHRVQFTRDKMNEAFTSLIRTSQFQTEYLSKQMLNNLFHLCGIERGDTIPENELRKCYWLPLTDHLTLKYEETDLVSIKECAPLGGHSWNSSGDGENEKGGKDITIGTEENTIIMILPFNKLPWEVATKPGDNSFVEQYIPLMQWLLDKHIDFLLDLQKQRDEVVEEWTDIRDGISRSEKIAVFEQKALKLPKTDYNRISSWLNSTLGLKLESEEIMPSNKLSKRIYNFFLHSATVDFPELSIEQRGNQAYTKWRNLLFELTDQIPALNKVVSKLPGEDPVPVLDVLAKQLGPIVSAYIKETWEKQNPITSGKPNLNLMQILHPDKHESTEDCVRLYKEIVTIFSKSIFDLILEVKRHKETLKALYEQRAQTDAGATSKSESMDMRQETIKNLTKLLEKLAAQ